MAEDGLLFKIFAQISDNTQKVPLNAVVVFSAATSIIALLFDIETLVEFLSIGTLLACTIVSACMIVLRYRPTSSGGGITEGSGGRIGNWVPGQSWLSVPCPGAVVTWSVFLMIIGDSGVSVIFATGYARTMAGAIASALFALVSLASFVMICLHHQNKAQVSFKVPFVPLVPAISILVNILLMLHLAPVTWLHLVVWLATGATVTGMEVPQQWAQILERHPLRFGFDNGEVVAVCPSDGDPVWAVNLKRAVLSTFQSMHESDWETGVIGECPAKRENHKSGPALTMKTTKNVAACHRGEDVSGLRAVPYKSNSIRFCSLIIT
ncbi:unnamed protein product [Toxocara canis]|uniref:AA_permease_C domain-containing protein n=1 Tax=Toxocara canis TaxID=6265 RepID=A0A183VFW4_TOXCA|nr:unnamed protein product [Toxocara canis]